MAIWKEIRCDGPPANLDCFSNRNDGPQGFESIGALRSVAQKEGWIIKGGKDLCPSCRKVSQ